MISQIQAANPDTLKRLTRFFSAYAHNIGSSEKVAARINALYSSGRDEFYALDEAEQILALVHLRSRTNLDHFSAYTELVAIFIHPSCELEALAPLVIADITALAKQRGSCGLWIAFPQTDPSVQERLFINNGIAANGVLLAKELDASCIPPASEKGSRLTIRPARHEDADILARLMLNLDTPGISPGDLCRQMDSIGSYDSDAFIVCEDEGEPCGLCYYRDRYDFLSDETFGEIVLLSVDANKQGRGIGKALLQHGERLAFQRKCRQMWICSGNNEREFDSHTFYSYLGYRQIGHKLEHIFR